MIFLGAGASAPFGIPTSKKLTEEMKNMLSKEHKKLLADISDFWGRYNEGKAPNYENILTFLMGLTDPRKIPRDSIVQAFVNDFKSHTGNYESIINEMYSKIIEFCTAPFLLGDKFIEPAKLETIFQNTYDLFTLLSGETIFTTNYDPSIEIWCQKRNIQLSDGSSATRNPEVREILPINDETVAVGNTHFGGGKENSLKIVRLHGSVWTYEIKNKRKIRINRPRDRLLFTDWYSCLERKPCMIFPGQESLLASLEWDTYYQYFKGMLQKNCLVIGYSFNDDLINHAFIDNLDKGLLDKVGIVNPHPDEVIKNLFWNREIPHDRIVRISAEFGKETGIQSIYHAWISGALRTRYTAGILARLSENRKRMKDYLM